MSKHVNQDYGQNSEKSLQGSMATPSIASRYEESPERSSTILPNQQQAQTFQEEGVLLQDTIEPASTEQQATLTPEPAYDYAEDYFPNSATQSYLHDSYYPHFYYEDWHDTAYSETDRALDEHKNDTYEAQAYSAQEAAYRHERHEQPYENSHVNQGSSGAETTSSQSYTYQSYLGSEPNPSQGDSYNSFLAATAGLITQSPYQALSDNVSPQLSAQTLAESFTAGSQVAHVSQKAYADIPSEKSLIEESLLSERQSETTLSNVTFSNSEALIDDRFISNHEHLTMAGAASLSALDFAGHSILSTGKATANVVDRFASVAAHEDEEFGRIDDARHLLVDSVAKEIPKHHSHEHHGLLHDAKIAALEHLIESNNGGNELYQVNTREQSSPVNAEELLERTSARTDMAETQLIDKKKQEATIEDSGKKKEKKPTTKRERDIAAKKKKIADAKLDKGGKGLTMLAPVNAAKRGALTGVGATKNLATSSVSKVITKENEEVASLMAMTDRTKKTARNAQKLARLPQKLAHGVHQTAAFIKSVANMVVNAISAALSLGWPFVLGLFLLLIVVVVVMVGSLSILNEDQETSEVAALVAKLDEDLEERIHEYAQVDNGHIIPIYYLDARGTYNTFDENDKDLTVDADLKDGTSDLQVVDPSSIDVYTNPDEIIAYIDAKYEGEWQVGAASWKFTVDWNDKTYNIFDWENVPEFVQNGLNKVDRGQFKDGIRYIVHEYLSDSFPHLSEFDILRVSESVADGLGNVIFDQQIQNISDEVIYEIISAAAKKHKNDLELSNNQLRTLNYEIMEAVTDLVGEQEPVALVYDEIVELHGLLNYWSEDYEHIEVTQATGSGGVTSGTASTNNAYGYPNASGYDPEELANWDGYNEVSVYGISEAGTTSVTADGTRIANNWNDTTMAIACEGLQNSHFAYWASSYQRLHGNTGPVKITLYNPATGATVTAEVRDCGGWRGFNPRYQGMNATRQWDLLPAVWKALAGTESYGLMNVYWKVDNSASVTSLGQAATVTIESYPWEKETDNISGEIRVNRATYIRHSVEDLLHNIPRLEKMIGEDNFATYEEFQAVVDYVSFKVKDVMLPVLTTENADGQSFTDYMMTRRELGNPFGSVEGNPVQWVVAERFNPGYDDSFDKEAVSVGIKPLNGDLSVYAVKKGTVIEATGSSVTVSVKIDEDVDERIVYDGLKSIQVTEGDKVKTGTKLGSLKNGDSSLIISWYENFTYVGDWDRQRTWAYCPSLFMQGFAGYEEPEAPTEYIGGAVRDIEDCETIVDFAHSRLGCPYVWGATGPTIFDCSGLTQWCYRQTGIVIPRNSEAQYNAAAAAGNIVPLDESKLQPGDILWKPGHVGIYIGNNQYIHAPQTGDVVKISTGIAYFKCGLRFV